MAVVASFNPATHQLTVTGDAAANTITISRNAAGNILVNGGAVPITGGTPTVANTSLIEVLGLNRNDVLALDESNGALPAAVLVGGPSDDTLTGGSGGDQLSGEDDDDVLLGKGGNDILNGDDGDDVLTGGDGDDQMFGGLGNDRMIWNPGDDSDLMEGGDGSDTAEVNGGNGDETFTITANGSRVRFDRVTPAPFSLDIGTTEALVVRANGGNDIITAGNGLAALIQLTLDGGIGNDAITGGDGADSLLGGDGNDTVTGARGNDFAQLGAGDDTFVWNPGDGSDTVEGDSGLDTLLFNGANINETIDIASNGARARFARDVASIIEDLNRVETITFNALGGADTIRVHDLSGTSVSQVNLDLGMSGGGPDGASDQIVVDGTAANNHVVVNRDAAGTVFVNGLHPVIALSDVDFTLDLLVVSGFGGNDTIALDESSGALLPASLDGGTGDDTLTGGSGNDLLFGEADDDTLLGKGGTDVLNGGDGDDVLTGGDGDDQMLGEAGNDRMIWNPGDDTDLLEGGDDSDTAEVNGGNGDEVFTITPNGGRVRFDRVDPAPFSLDIGTTEFLVLKANGGNDTITASSGLTGLILLTLDGGIGNDTITGGGGVDTLLGGDGNDTVAGGFGNDVVQLGAGDDTFIWNPGDASDTVDGQSGADTVQFNGANIAEIFELSANGSQARFTRNIGSISQDLTRIETFNLRALGGADTVRIHDLTGTQVSQVNIDLAGDGAPDEIFVDGKATNDTITVTAAGGGIRVSGLHLRPTVTLTGAEGGLDTLTVQGLGGDDVMDASTLPTGSIKLVLDGGEGNDVLTGDPGATTVLGGIGNDRVIDTDFVTFDAYDGGDGTDTVDYSQIAFSDGLVTINLGTGQTAVNGGNTETIANFENAIGSQGGETLIGSAGNNVLDAQGGNDTLDGGGGNDTLTGGAGDDTFFVDGNSDKVFEATAGGSDTVFASGNYTLQAGQEVEFLRANAGGTGLKLTGNQFANTLVGGSGDDTLDGSTGVDTMQGGLGNDIYFSENASDVIDETGGDGVDLVLSSRSFSLVPGARVLGDVENLTLTGSLDLNGTGNALDNEIVGNTGSNSLSGNEGDDTLEGGGGNDSLQGGLGADRLEGDAGADTFIFESTAESTVAGGGRDLILDFSRPQGDKIDLAHIDANTTLGGNQAFAFIAAAAFSGAAGELRFAASGANTLVSGDVNGDAVADFSILLRGTLTLQAGDFAL